MKKLISLFILVSGFNAAYSQCTSFLGGDKTICVGNAPVNYNDLYFTNATFVATALTPTDTIKGTGGAMDTVLLWAAKTKLVSTLLNGCKDSSILRVRNRVYPLPNLGPDTTLNLSVQQEFTSILSFADGISFTSGYNNHNWSTPTPGNVDTGRYLLTVLTLDGCADDKVIKVICAIKKDTVVKKCVGTERYDLTALFVKSGYSNVWKTIRFPQMDTVPTTNQAIADTGRYLLFTSKAGRCTDTVFVRVDTFPRLTMGPDRRLVKCFGAGIDLTKEFNLFNLTTQWTVPDATKAPIGDHRLIATNSDGCKDTVFVNVRDTVKPYIGPDENERICPTGNLINLTSNFQINDLRAEWNTPDPTRVNDPGTYRVIATNGFGCKDTAFFTVEHFDKPGFLNDTIVKICGGKVKDLNTIFNLSEDYALVDWSTANSSAAGAGDYKITIRNIFTECDFTANVTVEVLNSVAPNLNVCVFNMGSTSAFTTNYFRTAIIDKRGHVWAGTEDGGLYRFSPLPGTACGGIWEKNNPFSGIKAAINRYKDLQVSNIIGDTSIWAASQGYDHPRDITGGIDHVLNLNAPLEHFGSVNVPNSTDLGSRNVNSITIGNSSKIYAALGQSLTYDATVSTILEGGIYHNSLINTSPDFTQFLPNLPLKDVRVTATGKRGPNKIWFAVDKSCDPLSGGCITPYISEINDPSMLVTKTYNETNSVIPFDMPNLLIRSIFTASDGRTYVGLNSGVGIAVLEKDDGVTTPNWTLVNQSNSPILANTSVNFNAITEVNGEIWIGTTQGLLVYDGVSPLTECASFTLYTTAQGLPSNNVTDIAYDDKTFSIWLTTNMGICKILQNDVITGNVYNASCGSYTALRSTIKKIPLKAATVKLFETISGLPGNLIATKVTDVTGGFEFANLIRSKRYTIEVNYKNSDYLYRYNNLKSNTLIGDIIIPDSLKTEMKELMGNLPLYELKMDLYGYPLLVGNAQGFDTANNQLPFDFYINNVIENKHNERVENIANYYMAIATINAMAKNRTYLRGEQYSAVMDAIQSLAAFTDFGSEFNRKNLGIENIPLNTALRAIIKDLFILIKYLFQASIETIQDPEIKQDFKENVLPNINAAIDLLANLFNNGAKGTVLNEALELLKKTILVGATKKSHELFCKEYHYNLIKFLAFQSKDLFSSKKYGSAYPIVYSVSTPVPPALPSLNLQQITIHSTYKDEISLLKDGAKFADAAAGTFEAIADLKAGSISKAMKVFAIVSKSLNTGMLFTAAFKGIEGANEIDKLSLLVPRQNGFNGSFVIARPNQQSAPKNLSPNTVLDDLRAKRTIYNQRLSELKPFYNQQFDSVLYYSKVKQYFYADSIFKAEIESVNYMLQPRISEAVRTVNNFLPRFKLAMDTVTNSLFIDGNYFAIENISFMINPDSAALRTSLSSSVEKIKTWSNLLVESYEELLTITSSIITPAYLVNLNYVSDFSNQPNSNGSFTYTLKNIGSTTQTNVGALIAQPEGGFIITSPAFVNLGNFAPGQSKQLKFSFTSPATDAMGNYTIKMFADNGIYTNINGILNAQLAVDNTAPVSIKAGNWNDPTVWSTRQVPAAISAVTIRHNVIVNVDATVKSLKAESPGLVQVASGINLIILK